MTKIFVRDGGTLKRSKVKVGAVYVADYATPQLAANAASGKHLVFPANQTYTTTGITVPAGCYVEGNDSTLKFAANTTLTTSDDELVKVNGSGVTVDNLNFDANGLNQSGVYSQHRHCVRILGSFDNVTVKNCNMVNLIGDGVYVNTQTHGPITVGPNNIISANYDARNGVSVTSGDTVEIFGNTFSTITKSTFPGHVDIEANSTSDHLQHVDVHNNTFIGGSTAGTGDITAVIYTGIYAPLCPAADIKVRNNDISGTRFTCGVMAIGVNGGPFGAVTGLVFDGNNIHGMNSTGTIGVSINYWLGADAINNTINGTDYGIYNYFACLGTSTGNTFIGLAHPGTGGVTTDTPHCS